MLDRAARRRCRASFAPVPNQAGPGQRLEHGRPDQHAAGEEEHVLERVHDVVVQRRLVEERQVPDVEVDRPEREARRAGAPRTRSRSTYGQRQHRPQDRPGQPGDHAAAAPGRRARCAGSCARTGTASRRARRSARRARGRARPSPRRRRPRRQRATGVPRARERARRGGSRGTPSTARLASWSGSNVQLVSGETAAATVPV